MNSSDTIRSLEVLDASPDPGGCGCGDCGCGGIDPSTPDLSIEEAPMNSDQTLRFEVIGMTCGHCASAVTSELRALDGVTDVQVDLVAGGTSTVTVTSRSPLEEPQVAGALAEAGDYQLA
jgi:copper chaperone CopZ